MKKKIGKVIIDDSYWKKRVIEIKQLEKNNFDINGMVIMRKWFDLFYEKQEWLKNKS